MTHCRRCGFAGGGVALLEEVYHYGMGLEVPSYAQALPRAEVALVLAPLDQNVELLALPAPCLPARLHASCHDDNNGLSL